MYKHYLSAFRKLPVILSALFIALVLPLISLPEITRADYNNTWADNWNTPEYPGTSWHQGVEVYSNGSTTGYKDCNGNAVSTYSAACKNSVNGVVSGAEWQCVELFNRYYLANNLISSTWTGSGNTLINNIPSGKGFTTQAYNAVTYINPGDAIAFDDGGSGHVVIVDSVSGSTVNVVSQNTQGVLWSVTWSNNTLSQTYLGTSYNVQAVIHAPGDSPPAPTSPVPWNFETLDGDSNSVGQYVADVGQNAQSIVYNNSLQVFYYDRTNGRLRHAWENNGSWTFEVLDGNGSGGTNGRTTDNVGAAISVTTYSGTLQVFYYDVTAHTLRHAWSDATGWHFETLDSSGDVGSASTTFTYGTSLQLYYPNLTNGDLRHAWSDSSGWHFEDLDGDSGSVAGQQSMNVTNVGASLASTLDGNGNIQLFYYSSTSQGLRHAWNDSSGWHFENLDGGGLGSLSGSSDIIGENPSVVLDGTSLQVFTYNYSKGDLRHLWTDSSGWHFENLDGVGSTGPDQYTLGLYSTTVMSGTTLQVFYYDSQWGELRHAWSDSAGWHFENLDGLGGLPSGRLGPNMDIGKLPNAVIYNSVPQVFYYDATNGNLRHAWSQ